MADFHKNKESLSDLGGTDLGGRFVPLQYDKISAPSSCPRKRTANERLIL